MKSSAKLAFGIALVWLAGVLFFVAFHPNGVVMADGKSAGNPVDVLKYVISQRGTLGDLGKAKSNGIPGTTQGPPAAGDQPV